jgi:glycerol-3-phosphate dehydrogenase
MPDVDLIVIGAGILGAGVAQAAAAAGYRVRVLERGAPAAGTSSRSSKLIHGGLRYLESGQFGLVREALRERALLLRNAPDLVKPMRFLLPVYRQTSRRPPALAAGLLLYRLLGGGAGLNLGFGLIPSRRWDNPDGLDTHGLQAVFAYPDAQTDDAALTRAVLHSAQDLGAELLCPAEVVASTARPDGYGVTHVQDGRAAETTCAALVNAAGPWVNRVLARMTPPRPPLPIDLVQGAHVVLKGGLRAGAYYVEARDRRAVFILPGPGEITLVGTTETLFSGDPDEVHPLPEEATYLLGTVARHFPRRPQVVESAFAGLRVLPRGSGAPFGRGRETLLATDGGRPARLVSVCGGKLTTYRATAEKVLRLLAPALPAPKRRLDTRRIRLALA